MCRSKASHSFDRTIPQNFVPRHFDSSIQGTSVETGNFPQFVDKVLAMPRKSYRLFIACLSTYFDALEALGSNFDLAYSMMAYMLEAGSKSIERPTVTWNDYDEAIRGKIDRLMDPIDPQVGEKLRAVLLANQHLKLTKRFTGFIEDNLTEAFYTDEAANIKFALARSDARRALANLYNTRSGYVHDLKQAQEHLRLRWTGSDSDVFHWHASPT